MADAVIPVLQLSKKERDEKLKQIGESVRGLLIRVITSISDMIKDLRDEKPPLTKVSTAMIDMAIEHMKTADMREVILLFYKEHERWDRALNKDMKFFTDDIVVVLKKIPNAQALREPITIYQQHLEEDFKNYPRGKAKFPIKPIDFDRMFSVALYIIQGACSYNKAREAPDPVIYAYNERVYALAAIEKAKEKEAAEAAAAKKGKK